MKKVIVLFVLLIVLSCYCLSACNLSQESSKSFSTGEQDESPITGGTKALIFIPGILGSQLYNVETGQYIWDFFTTEEVSNCILGDNLIQAMKTEMAQNPKNILKIINDVVGQKETSVIAQMLSDQNGDLVNQTTQAYPVSQDRRQYGAFACYEQTMKALKERYGSAYEVVFFNYNWLADVRLAAQELETLVLENNYTDIVLVSHSMGGLVASSFLTNLQNRRRVVKNILIASPLYGAAEALDALETNNYFDGYVNTLKGLISLLPLGNFGSVLSEMLEKAKTGDMSKLIINTTTVFQLLPSKELAELVPQMITQEGQEVTENNLYDFYASRNWAKKDDGSIHGALGKYQALRDFLYVQKGEERIFSTELVDSYYIGGTGYRTAYGFDFQNDKYTITNLYEGDGTVSLVSATLGKQVDNEHVFAVHDNHSMGNVLDGECKDIVFSIIDPLLGIE